MSFIDPKNETPIARLARQSLASHRINAPATSDEADLELSENVIRFLRSEVSRPLLRREHLGAIFVDDNARPIAFNLPYRGYIGRQRIDPRKLLGPAMMVHASALILFHNHPRGRRTGTRRDVKIARNVRAACELVGLRLLDYLVLAGDDRWTSFRHQRRVRFHSLGEDLPIPGEDRRTTVKPKYRNPDPPHQTWSGRGKMAKWLREKLEADAGARLLDFLIEDP